MPIACQLISALRALCPCVALQLAAAAPAQVVFSTYGPSDSYSNSFISATFAGYGKNAARFVPTTGAEFNQIETSLSRVSGPPGIVGTMLMVVPEVLATGGPSGSGPQPGTLPIWCSTSVNATLDARAIYTFTGPRASLIAGQAYWVVIEASDATNWYHSLPPLFGNTAFKNGSPWIAMTSAILPAMRISNVATSTTTGPCCNTASGGCIVLESTACVALGLRYGPTGAACAPGPSAACPACPADFDHSGDLSVQDIFNYLGAWFAGCP